MHMNFWFDVNLGDLLFKGLTISSTEGLLFTCFGLASLAILFEAIKVQFVTLKHSAFLKKKSSHPSECPNDCSLLLNPEQVQHSKLIQKLPESLFNVCWYILQTVVSYILMLSVMTYNGYLAVSVSVGAGLGYLIFGPVLMEIEMKYQRMRHSEKGCPACKAKAEDQSSLITEVTDSVANQDVEIPTSD